MIGGSLTCGNRQVSLANYEASSLTKPIVSASGQETSDLIMLTWVGCPGWSPAHIVFYAALATMPNYILKNVKTLLQMCSDAREIRLTNNHPNIHLATLEMLDPLNLCHDIARMLVFTGDPPPPTFMVFCNDCKETECVCLYAQSLAPAGSVDKLLWFHSGMSTHF
jgi:hypothetical protein